MEFEPKRMERGRGQVLYRFRPDQTFDHVGGFEAQVSMYLPDEAYQGPRVDPGFLISEAIRFVERWRIEGQSAQGTNPGADPAVGFPPQGPLVHEQYEVFVPGKVSCRVWPRAVRCGSRSCGMVWSAPEPSLGANWPPMCPRCGHKDNKQLQYLFVHNCGNAYEFSPPRRCGRCGRNQFSLNDAAVSRFIDFRWQCLNCGQAEQLQAFCANPNCRWSKKLMSPQVHTASSAYSGQGFTVVNVPLERFAELRSLPQFVVSSIAQWLGIISSSDLDALMSGSASQEVPREILSAIESLEQAGLVEQAQGLRKRFVPVDFEATRSRVIEELGFDPTAESERVRSEQLAAQIEIYRRVQMLPKLGLSDIERQASSPSRQELYSRYQEVLTLAGIQPDRMALITSFPVTRAALGYTRNGFAPEEADLVPYKGRLGRGQAERTLLPIYPTQTEALLFTLDYHRVARWVIANGFAAEWELGDSAIDILGWFARGMGSYEGQIPLWTDSDDAGASQERGARAVFRLLHSMAHQVLRALAVDSGFQETGLSEYLFPFALAFAIYPNAGGEFTIGGLRTVMEQSLSDVVSRAMENSACIYDPNCLTANRGADHGCLYLPETACQMWNRDLSRWELFGGSDAQDSNSVEGYWSPSML